MIKLKYIFLLMLPFIQIIHPYTCHTIEFCLLTTLYEENKPFRIAEYRECLQKNCSNPLIKKIIIFKQGNPKINLSHPKISVVDIFFRPSYKDFMKYVDNHEEFKNKIIIIANGDIYFDKSLNKLKNFNWQNKFLALTRYQVYPTGWKRRRTSFDTWIYKSPLYAYPTNELKIGTPTHDVRFVWQMVKHNLKVSNPSLDIVTWHLDSIIPTQKPYADPSKIKELRKNKEFEQGFNYIRSKLPFTQLSKTETRAGTLKRYCSLLAP